VAGVGASKEAPWGSSPERGERGKERGVVGVTGGCQGGCRRGGGSAWAAPCYLPVRDACCT
jgi:hypothetical protein